jgi:hypothetical protein
MSIKKWCDNSAHLRCGPLDADEVPVRAAVRLKLFARAGLCNFCYTCSNVSQSKEQQEKGVVLIWGLFL